MDLTIREIINEDINLIADYWLLSPPEFLMSMGVDLAKRPSRESFTKMLESQIQSPLIEKQTYALIWEIDGKAVGHCNVNNIDFGKSAFMHLHFWNQENRKKGMGIDFVKKSMAMFFETLELKTICCEPYALNPAPNKVLSKVGFAFVKTHVCIPGSLNFEQEVNLWKMDRNVFRNEHS